MVRIVFFLYAISALSLWFREINLFLEWPLAGTSSNLISHFTYHYHFIISTLSGAQDFCWVKFSKKIIFLNLRKKSLIFVLTLRHIVIWWQRISQLITFVSKSEVTQRKGEVNVEGTGSCFVTNCNSLSPTNCLINEIFKSLTTFAKNVKCF